jgi:hypothetical protein
MLSLSTFIGRHMGPAYTELVNSRTPFLLLLMIVDLVNLHAVGTMCSCISGGVAVVILSSGCVIGD